MKHQTWSLILLLVFVLSGLFGCRQPVIPPDNKPTEPEIEPRPQPPPFPVSCRLRLEKLEVKAVAVLAFQAKKHCGISESQLLRFLDSEGIL